MKVKAMTRCHSLRLTALTIVAVVLVGCGHRPELAPVRGTVRFRGKLLTFGSVMFQPASGQPARGTIRPDGSFQLSTYAEGDGAATGEHRIRITCYARQNPQSNAATLRREPGLGKLLIPEKYTFFDTSNLTATVEPARTNEFQFNLE